MKCRKILSLVLACITVLSMSVPAFAAEEDISIIDVPKSSKTKIEPIVDTVEEVLPEEKISEAMDVLRDAREKSESVDSVEGQTDGEEVASSVDENEGNK